MPKFSEYTQTQVRKLSPSPLKTEKEAVDFYEGDHWRQGAGWTGPTPRPTNPEAVYILAEISRQFVSRNIVKVVVDRHVSSLIASEPSWMFVPTRILEDDEEATAEEEAQIKIAEQIVTEWWDKTRALEKLKLAVVDCLIKGRGSLRVFVPPLKVKSIPSDDGTTIPIIETQKLEDGIKNLLFIEKSNAFVVTDEDTMEQASILIKKNKENEEIIEFCYVQDDGTTLIRTWTKSNTPDDTVLNLDGRLIVKEILREPLVTNQMLSAQKSLNMSLTMLDRNAIQGGFLERVILNAEPPGTWTSDSSGLKTFSPAPLQIGAGKTTFIASKIIDSTESGEPPLVLPADIRWKDPISPDTFIKTAAEHRYGIYEEASQLHALISADATASAVSRIQARADFLDSLTKTKPQIDEAVRWLMEIAIDHACIFAGLDRQKEFGLIRAACDVQMSTGPLTPEERQAVMEMIDKEMMSLETGMQLLGVEDVDAERSRLSKELENPNPARKIKLMEAYAKIGYSLAPDQLDEVDEEIGVKVRDMEVVTEEQSMDQDMKREQLRQQRNASGTKE